MSESYVVPTHEDVSELLEMLFGEPVEVDATSPTDAADKYVATFLDDEDKLVAVCQCDLPFVAYSGAALSMISPGVAEEMIKDGTLSDMVVANFNEVMNICSKLMISDQSAHLRYANAHPPGEGNDAIDSLNGAATRVGFELTVPKYGKGGMEFTIGG